MRVALHAIDCDPVQHRPGCGDAVHNRDHAEFLIIGAALVVAWSLPMKGASDAVLKGGFGKQVSGQLFDHELIVRQIAIEGVNHPVAIGPDSRALPVLFVTFCIRISCQVQPHGRPAFAIAWRSQQTIHLFFVSVGGGIRQIRCFFLGCRRQSGEVERHPAQQGCLVGFRRRCQPFFLQPRQNKLIHGLARPIRSPNFRQGLSLGWYKRPIVLPVGSLLDPLAK